MSQLKVQVLNGAVHDVKAATTLKDAIKEAGVRDPSRYYYRLQMEDKDGKASKKLLKDSELSRAIEETDVHVMLVPKVVAG